MSSLKERPIMCLSLGNSGKVCRDFQNKKQDLLLVGLLRNQGYLPNLPDVPSDDLNHQLCESLCHQKSFDQSVVVSSFHSEKEV